MKASLPIRTLPEHPDLEQLKRQAKELLEAFQSAEPAARAEVNAYYRDADPAKFALHDAQLVLARSYGLESWPKLKARVDGVTIERLCAAVERGDTDTARGLLRRRPEIVNLERPGHGEQCALQIAVMRRDPGMVRLLMANGADARVGMWPYRGETKALTLAAERGFNEIVAIIEEAEARRRGPDAPDARVLSEVAHAIPDIIRRGDEAGMIELLGKHPELIRAYHPQDKTTPLHIASRMLWERTATWLLDRSADVNAPDRGGGTPLDVVGCGRGPRQTGTPERVKSMTDLLIANGAKQSARSAIAVGDVDWLRARHAEGTLENPPQGNGLLTLAVRYDRPDILELLLNLGFDPDERVRDEGPESGYSWGRPLANCTNSGKLAMARMLLERGADPNAWEVVWNAYRARDAPMIELLDQYGGVPNAATPCYLRDVDLVSKMFADHAAGRTLAEEMIDPAATGGDPEILRMVLDRIDWPRDDQRWYGILVSPLCFWHEIPWIKTERWQMDRTTYLPCFRMVLEKCSPDVSGTHGRTILHHAAAAYDWLTTEEHVAFVKALLDAGARTELRDHLLKSTPLGWACRWGRVEVVKLLLARGADPIEADAERWATPLAWAEKMKHDPIVALLREVAR